ncbi:MAG: hypothetical protein AAGA60_21500 [Cyanobacteria bacterium P01_E01_bin.42]
MKRTFLLILSVLICWLTLTASSLAVSSTSAQIVKRGVFDCFDPSLSYPEDGSKPVYCETSAVIAANGKIYTASDKGIPGASSVMTLKQKRNNRFVLGKYVMKSPAILRLQKAEDFALATGGDRVFLASGFDRVRSDSNEWDAYNMLVTWTVRREKQALVIEPSGEPETSVSLRSRLQATLPTEDFPEGAPYFKVEGLAFLPDNRLLFGIREIGQDYEVFDYTLQLVAAEWDESDPQHLGTFKRIYKYDPQTNPQINWPVGLSSIAWDSFHDELLILTSYEKEGTDIGLGAYLWTLSLEDLEAGNPPTLIVKANGEPLVFAHKAEAVTVLSSDRLLVIHDDDRVLGEEPIDNPEEEFYREPYQAAYTVVEWLD